MSQQLERLRGRLAEIESSIDDDPLTRNPRSHRLVGSIEQELAHVGDHIGIDGIRVSHTGLETDVRRHHGRSRRRSHVDVLWVAEAGDVVADDGTCGEALLRHAGPPGVDRDRCVKPGGQG